MSCTPFIKLKFGLHKAFGLMSNITLFKREAKSMPRD
jgi:hypothetical protein